eukprot:4973306-Pyramimonas_sp.AAC.1
MRLSRRTAIKAWSVHSLGLPTILVTLTVARTMSISGTSLGTFSKPYALGTPVDNTPCYRQTCAPTGVLVLRVAAGLLFQSHAPRVPTSTAFPIQKTWLWTGGVPELLEGSLGGFECLLPNKYAYEVGLAIGQKTAVAVEELPSPPSLPPLPPPDYLPPDPIEVAFSRMVARQEAQPAAKASVPIPATQRVWERKLSESATRRNSEQKALLAKWAQKGAFGSYCDRLGRQAALYPAAKSA